MGPVLGTLVNVVSGVAAAMAASASATRGGSPARQQSMAIAVGTGVHALGQLAGSALDAAKGLAETRHGLSKWNNLIATASIQLTMGRMMREREFASAISGSTHALLRSTDAMEESWQSWKRFSGTMSNVFGVFTRTLGRAAGNIVDFGLKASGFAEFANDVEKAMGKKMGYSPLGEAVSDYAWHGKFGGQRPEWVPDSSAEGGHWKVMGKSSAEQKAVDAKAAAIEEDANLQVAKKTAFGLVGGIIGGVAGSFIPIPVVGTAVGATIGATAGAALGVALGLNAAEASPPYSKAPGE